MQRDNCFASLFNEVLIEDLQRVHKVGLPTEDPPANSAKLQEGTWDCD